jgi:hypothetical protein
VRTADPADRQELLKVSSHCMFPSLQLPRTWPCDPGNANHDVRRDRESENDTKEENPV